MEWEVTNKKVDEAKVTEIAYGGKTYKVPTLSSTGFTFTPTRISHNVHETNPESLNIIQDFNTIWQYQKLGSTIRKPLRLGHIPEPHRSAFNCDTLKEPLRVLDMPIKFKGSIEYRIPEELLQFRPVIQQIANYQYTLHPAPEDYYCYITIDQGDIPPGQMQRNSGCHVDGFQGSRIDPKVQIDHDFITFQTSHLDPSLHNFFHELDKQAKEEAEWRPEPFEIVLFDAYTVHRGDVVKGSQSIKRTFLRMSYSVREFDRLGNTHNPMFDYHWEMVARDIHTVLN